MHRLIMLIALLSSTAFGSAPHFTLQRTADYTADPPVLIVDVGVAKVEGWAGAQAYIEPQNVEYLSTDFHGFVGITSQADAHQHVVAAGVQPGDPAIALDGAFVFATLTFEITGPFPTVMLSPRSTSGYIPSRCTDLGGNDLGAIVPSLSVQVPNPGDYRASGTVNVSDILWALGHWGANGDDALEVLLDVLANAGAVYENFAPPIDAPPAVATSSPVELRQMRKCAGSFGSTGSRYWMLASHFKWCLTTLDGGFTCIRVRQWCPVTCADCDSEETGCACSFLHAWDLLVVSTDHFNDYIACERERALVPDTDYELICHNGGPSPCNDCENQHPLP